MEGSVIGSDPRPETRSNHIKTDLSCHRSGLVSDVRQLFIARPPCFCKNKHKSREAEPKRADPRLRVYILFTRPHTAALVAENTLLQWCRHTLSLF